MSHNTRGLNKGRRELYSEFESMREDLSHLRRDLAAFGQALLKFGKSEMGTAGSRLKAEIQKKVDALAEDVDGVRERGRESIESVQHRIEEHPFTSLGIAFGVGLILGKLFDRRSDSE